MDMTEFGTTTLVDITDSSQLAGADSGALTTALRYPVSLLAGGNPKIFAASYGVTGTNDGTRDDAPLLRTACAAIKAAGLKTMVLPVGDVYVDSFEDGTAAGGYPHARMVTIDEDDFTVIVPYGCTVYTQEIESTSADAWSIFCFYNSAGTVKRSGITGGGEFIAAGAEMSFCVPGYITSNTDECFITNLKAQNFWPQAVGVFDCSTANRAIMELLTVRDCFAGIMQSSTSASAKVLIRDCSVYNYQKYAFACNGPKSSLYNLLADNSVSGVGAGLVQYNAGVCLKSRSEGHTLSNITVIGRNNTSTYSCYAIWQNMGISGTSQPISVDNLKCDNLYSALHINNSRVPVVATNLNVTNVDKLVEVAGSQSHNVKIRGVTGYVNGTAINNASSGTVNIDLVDLDLGSVGAFSGTTTIRNLINCYPKSAITRPTLAAGDAGAQFWDNTLGYYIFWSGSAWINALGDAV